MEHGGLLAFASDLICREFESKEVTFGPFIEDHFDARGGTSADEPVCDIHECLFIGGDDRRSDPEAVPRKNLFSFAFDKVDDGSSTESCAVVGDDHMHERIALGLHRTIGHSSRFAGCASRGESFAFGVGFEFKEPRPAFEIRFAVAIVLHRRQERSTVSASGRKKG